MEIRRRGMARQVDGDASAHAGFAGDRDRAAALGHDAVDHRHAQPDAFAGPLGGEKRLEEMGADLFIHAAAVVADGKNDEVAGVQSGMALDGARVQGAGAGRDAHLAAVRAWRRERSSPG